MSRPLALSSLLLLALCAGCAGTGAPRKQREERAAWLEEHGRWTEAGETWHGLWRSDPSDAEAARGLARALAAQGDADGAAAVLSGARASIGDDAGLCLDLGRLLATRGLRAEALEALGAAARADPERVAPRRAGGRLALELGRTDEARALLEEALALEPEDASTWSALARARDLSDDGDGALTAWSRAFAGGAFTVDEVLRAGALALGREEWLAPAEAWLARARASAPQRAETHRLHAQVALALGREADALEGLWRAVEVDPGDLGTLLLLARERARRGERDALERLVEHARAVGKDAELAPFTALLAELAEREAEAEAAADAESESESESDGEPDAEAGADVEAGAAGEDGGG